MTAKRYSVVIDGRTYEGRYSQTPKKKIDVLHVRGPLEWKRPMHHLFDLTERAWSSAPSSPRGSGPEFIAAGWQMVRMWEADNGVWES